MDFDFLTRNFVDSAGKAVRNFRKAIEESEPPEAELEALCENLTTFSHCRSLEKDFVIAGVDDPFRKHADLPKALQGVQPEDFVVLLAHAPNIAAQAVDLGVDLVLSGHTHGGQFKLPLLPAPYPHTGRGPRLEQGLYARERLSRRIGMDADHTQIYVSRGLGASYIPARLFCRPELPIITLRRG